MVDILEQLEKIRTSKDFEMSLSFVSSSGSSTNSTSSENEQEDRSTDSPSSSLDQRIKRNRSYLKAKLKKNKINPTNVMFKESSDGGLVPRLIIPQVVKTDVRLEYANILAYVYNSCNYELMSNYLYTYYRSDYCMMQDLSGILHNGLKGRFYVRGIETARKYWYERMIEQPDVLFTIKGIEVNINSDDEGVILINFTMGGTQMLPVLEPQINATSLIETSPGKDPIYVLGETLSKLNENVYDENLTSYQNDGKLIDFDTILPMDGNGNDNYKGKDFSVANVPDSSKILDSSEFSDSDNEGGENGISTTYHHPKKAARMSLLSSTSGSVTSSSPIIKSEEVDDEALVSYGLSNGIIPAACVDDKPLIVTNQPAAAKLTTISFCYQGFLRMHFDTDSRLYYNEFYLKM